MMAAGKGSRMQADRNKVYLELLGRPVLSYTLRAFEESRIDEIIIVATAGDEAYVEEAIVRKYGIDKVCKIVPGGGERFESVYHGIAACEGEEPEHYIFVHDGARPFIRPELINQCIEAVVQEKACVVAVPAKDTIRIVGSDGYPTMTPRRSDVWQMQTPQCFLLSEARQAFEIMMQSGDRDITDDVMVLERYGHRRSKMVSGSYENIKLTTPEDMIVGEEILKRYSGDKR